MQPAKAPAPASPLRVRALVLGTVLVPAVVLWVASMENIYGGRTTYLSIFFHAVVILAAVQGLNILLARAAPRYALNRAEVLLLYIMIGVSSGVVGDQFMAVMVPALSYPFRYATDANHWKELLLPYLPKFAMVSDPDAVRHFYEGGSTLYRAANLRPWLGPGLLWGGFIAVTQLMCLGLNVIIRRQWTQHEKLSFPLTILPLQMTAGGASSMWRQRLFWLGFALAAGVDVLNGLHVNFPAIPGLNLKVFWLSFGSRWDAALTTTGVAFYPFVIGTAYLLPSDLTFSSWFFLLFFRLQRYLFAALGFPSPYPWQSTGFSVAPAMLEQGIGSYMAVVAFGIWAARLHLGSVWDAVWRGPRDTGDSRTTITPAEVTEYRLALGVVAGGLVLTTAFAAALGMPVGTGFAYMLLYLVINVAITKVRAEAGAPTHGFHFAGPDHVLLTVMGPAHMRTRQMAAWGLFWGFNRAYTGVPMPHQLEGMKIGELTGMPRQRLTGILAFATALGCFAGVWALLHICFREGVEQMGHPVRDLAPQGWQLVSAWMQQPLGPNWPGLLGIVAGFAFSYFLMTMRYRFVWWQFHPIGYAIAADWTTGLIWLPLLIGWAGKSLAMRYLGPKAYRAGVPLALGLIMGEFIVGGFWSLLAMLTRKPQFSFWT
jgi:hypothetical protein